MKLGMRKCDSEWWRDCGNIAELFLWLVDEGDLDTNDPDAIGYFISKPWKWDLEFRTMLERKNLETQLTASLEARR